MHIYTEGSKHMEYTVDVSKPVTNPELVKALSHMRQVKTRESGDAVIELIKTAKFLVPIVLNKQPKRNEDGTVTFHDQTMIRFPLLQNAKKQSYFMAFTDWNELYKWSSGQDQTTAVFELKDYLDLLEGPNNEGAAGMVVNPYGGNLTLTRDMLRVLLKR